MRILGFMLISIVLLLSGCNNESSNEPAKKEKKTGNFQLVIESDKKSYKEDEEIQLHSYFEYVGEKGIEFDPKPSITIFIRKFDDENVIEKIDFNEVRATMKAGEKFTQTLNNLKLEKGKYDAYVQVSPFSIGSNQYSLNTAPIEFEVR